MSQRDVAREAGTSVAVVSYVLNNGPRPVAEATRQRVLDAMARLGYRPNSLAAALRSQRSTLVGMLVPDLMHPFFAEVASALAAAAFEHGLTVLSAGSGWDPARERRYVEELLRLRVRGIVMAPVGEDLGRLRSIVESGTRLVLVSHGRPEIGAPTVMSDAVAAGRLATEHLLAHGYETVVCLTGPDDAPPVGHRVRGWRAALREHGRSADAVLVRSGYDRYSAERAALGVLERQRGRVAVLGATDELALGVLAAAARLGRAVPAECAVVGCDGIPEGVQAVPALTTVAEPIEAIAASVVRCLLAERVPASPSPLPVALRLGGTCGPH